MNRPSLPPRDRARLRCRAFTLIELLTVIAIILVLAGLLLHVAGSANYKASTARATAEIQAMSTALEAYKADNGSYPRPTTAGNSSDKLNAQSSAESDPNGSDASTFQAAGQLLYQALSGTPATGTTLGKQYMEFKPGQLSDVSGSTLVPTTSPSSVTLVVDPFGIPYGYSTAAAYASDQVQAGSMTASAATAYGYNPTFDLWSSAGYSSSGKSYPSGVTAANYNTLWMKNW